jgi:hypothetical protein
MLNKFNSYSRKLNRVVPKINLNNLTNLDLTGSINLIEIPTEQSYESNYKKNPFTFNVTNTKNTIVDVTGSLSLVDVPIDRQYDSFVRNSDYQTNVINNKPNIEEFHNQILQYSARYVKKVISGFDSGSQQFYISSSILDYGTTEPTSDNFEIMVDGLHIPDIYKVEQSGSSVVIQLLKTGVVDWDLLDSNDRVVVYGKFLN